MNRKGFRSVRVLALSAAMTCSVGAVGTATSRVNETVRSTKGIQVSALQINAPTTSCAVTLDKNNTHMTANGSGDTTGTDRKVYLFELQSYEDGIGGRTDYITSTEVGAGVAFTIPLSHNTVSGRLYSRFMMAVYGTEGKIFMEVSSPYYVTNPEVIAKDQAELKMALSRRELNIELGMLADAFGLGAKHVSTDIAFSQLVETGIEYTYDGKVYHLNKAVVDNYDETISAMSNKGMTVTAIIPNNWNPATPELVYLGTKKVSNALYYMFNATAQKGFEETRAVAVFLVEYYNGPNPKVRKVSNRAIGNETNNQQWNHMGPMGLTNYVKAFQQAFRVLYTAIKSISANGRAYFSLGRYWSSAGDNSPRYIGHEIMEFFNAMCIIQGQMEWGLAYHPYPHPMTEPEFWDDTAMGTIIDDTKFPIINFANINILTDYTSGNIYKMPSGGVRHVILTEEGFTSRSATRGGIPKIQAAAYAYSYYPVGSNPYIDAYILSRQVDVPGEGDLRFGLWEYDRTQITKHVAANRRKIWQVFRNIDEKEQILPNTEFTRSIIKINKWSDVIPNFRWRSLEKQ